MPRGRPRKPRLTRMDAAVDAMAPYGFTEKQVKKAVKGLLEVYDGNDAWPVIEESSYILLIDTILSEVERIDQESAEDGNNVKDKPFDEGTSTGVSSRVSNIQDEETEENAPADVFKLSDEPAETAWPEEVGSSSRINYEGKDEVLTAGGSGKDWKGIIRDQTKNKTVNISRKNDGSGDSEAGLHLTISNPIQALPSLIPSSLPPRRRWPCYGWIESDEEEEPNDFIYLNQAPATVESTAATSTQNPGSCRGGTKSERKLKSRWDT